MSIFKLRITSFATRISLYIMAMIVVIFALVLGTYHYLSRNQVISSSIDIAYGNLNTLGIRVESQLKSVSQSIDETCWLLDTSSLDTANIKAVLVRNVQNNSAIIGSSLAFVPKEKQVATIYYASRSSLGIDFRRLNPKEYSYWGMDWYLIPKFLGEAYWSEPYYDDGAGGLVMATYSLPLRNSKGSIYAIYTADISLYQFTDQIENSEIIHNGSSFLLSRNGYYLTHRKKERIMSETIFSSAFAENNKEYEKIGRCMLAGESGGRRFNHEGDFSYAIYAPIPSVGWSICAVIEEKFLLAGLTSLMKNILIIFFAALLAFFVLTFLLVKRLVKPLEGFAQSAHQIAQGDFNASLPDVKMYDEMKQL
ncbi:MAG: SpoIIE family protein phosphatase, partial [Phocaeicola sp.]